MANICNQNLYLFAASDEAMKRLLLTMADNFKAATDTDALAGVAQGAEWRDLARSMGAASHSYNKLCFLSREPDSGSEGGSFYYSEAFGKPYVCVGMELKWGPSYQVEEFCRGLDGGLYGCACINGGEYTLDLDDDIAFIQWGENFGDPYDGMVDRAEFESWRAEVMGGAPGNLHEMALRELFESEDASSFFWGLDDEEGWDEPDGGHGVARRGRSWDVYSAIWARPTDLDVEMACEAVVAALGKFPWVVGVSGSAYEGREANVEGLVPGEVLRLESNWHSPFFRPVAIEVYTADRRGIGNLDSRWDEAMRIDDVERTALALILQHVRAYAERVEPLFALPKRNWSSRVRVRLELSDMPLSGLLGEVRELLSRQLIDRGVSSIVERGE